VAQYEDQLEKLKLKDKKKQQESVENLTTLLQELGNIEAANVELTEQLEEQKQANAQLIEEKDVQSKIITQMEGTLRRQETIMKRQSVFVQQEQDSISHAAGQNDIVRHLMVKMESMAELAMQLRVLAIGDTGEESILEAKLSKEKKEHEATRLVSVSSFRVVV